MKVDIYPSTRKDKKLMAVFDNGVTTHFGQKHASDFTIHKDPLRKARYIARHQVSEDWSNPFKAGTLSRYILWNKESLQDSINDFKKRFGFVL